MLAAPGINPYQEITRRNVFALKVPSPAPDATNAAQSPIILNGIITFGVKRALLTKRSWFGSLAAPAAPQSFIVGEGQRAGGIEVVEINEKLGAVTVIYEGTACTLHFEANGKGGRHLLPPKHKGPRRGGPLPGRHLVGVHLG